MGLRATIYARTKYKANTFIGGMSATLNTPALVASKLGIAVSRIKAFKIIGADIQFAITGGSYVIPNNVFLNTLAITYYDDFNGLCTSVTTGGFFGCSNLVYVNFPGCTVLGNSAFNGTKLTGVINFPLVNTINDSSFFRLVGNGIINFPNLTTINTTSLGAVFRDCNNYTLNVNISLKTASGGLPHPELCAWNTSNGANLGNCIVNYIGYIDDASYTTEIGFNVDPSTIFHKGTLGYRLGVGSGAIVNYQVIGNSIRFKLLKGIELKSSSFTGVSTVTYFDDSLGSPTGGIIALTNSSLTGVPNMRSLKLSLTTIAGQNSIRNLPLDIFEAPNVTTISTGQYLFRENTGTLQTVSLPNLTQINSTDAFYTDGYSVKNIYMPKCIKLGPTVALNGIFTNFTTGGTITVDISLMTANAGLPDADLTYVADTRGSSIEYAGIQPATNTDIGGVSSTINTKNLLATRLGVSRARLTNLQIVGADIKFTVVGNYTMPSGAFMSNTNVTYFNDTSGKITTLNPNTFRSATNLIYGIFPSLTTVGGQNTTNEGAFYGCSKLQYVTAPNLSTINWGGFTNCTELLTVNYPLLRNVGYKAFQNCHKAIFTADTTKYITTLNGGNEFDGCRAQVTWDFTSVTSLGGSTFLGNWLVEEYILPNLLTVGNNDIFRFNYALKGLNLPSCTQFSGRGNTVENNTEGQFKDNTAMTYFIAPLITKMVGNFTFNNCSGMTNIYIPLCSDLGGYSFDGTDNGFFTLIKTGCSITVPTSLQTVAGGSINPDLGYAISSRGAVVTYV